MRRRGQGGSGHQQSCQSLLKRSGVTLPCVVVDCLPCAWAQGLAQNY